MTAFILEVHDELAVLSCEFQKASLAFSEVQAQIDGTITKLEILASTDGPSLLDMKGRITVEVVKLCTVLILYSTNLQWKVNLTIREEVTLTA